MIRAADLTPAMRREVRAKARDGNPSDPCDWQHAPVGLWFHARERVITALIRRGILDDAQELTALGREIAANLDNPE